MHLYNIFKLKKTGNVKQGSQVPKQDEDDADMYDADSWVPPKIWTAWPLSPEAVPREQEERKWVEATILPPPYIARPKLPGDILRELLEAEILRKARLKFDQRSWADTDDNDDDGDDDDDDDMNEPTTMKPVIMADDERASKILRPTICTILGRLDALLMGLNSARNASLAFDDSGNESQSQTRVRSVSQPRNRKRKRVASRSDAITATTSEQTMMVSETDTSFASKSTSRLRGRRRSKLALRDWSDVLGIASMTGWDPAVVGKAASRCASLFEECITFRTLKEGDKGHTELCYKPGASTPLLATKEEGIDQKTKKGTLGGVHLNGFLEPIEGKKSWKYQSSRSGRGPGRPRSKD